MVVMIVTIDLSVNNTLSNTTR